MLHRLNFAHCAIITAAAACVTWATHTQAQPAPAAPATPASTASAPAPGKAPSGGVYKWKDAQGRVHYGDQPPAPKVEPMKLQVNRPSEEEVAAARERLEAMRAESAARAAERRAARGQAVPPPTSAATAPAPPANETTCQAQWRAYEEAQACFDPFKLASGAVSPEDMAKCKPVKRPAPCP